MLITHKTIAHAFAVMAINIYRQSSSCDAENQLNSCCCRDPTANISLLRQHLATPEYDEWRSGNEWPEAFLCIKHAAVDPKARLAILILAILQITFRPHISAVDIWIIAQLPSSIHDAELSYVEIATFCLCVAEWASVSEYVADISFAAWASMASWCSLYWPTHLAIPVVGGDMSARTMAEHQRYIQSCFDIMQRTIRTLRIANGEQA